MMIIIVEGTILVPLQCLFFGTFRSVVKREVKPPERSVS
jgi:hypothetical protein